MAHPPRSGLVPLLLFVSLLGAFSVACEPEDPDATNSGPPATAEEFLERLELALSRDGKVWHGTEVLTYLEDGKSRGSGEFEIWLAPASDRGRYHFKKHPDDEADIADEFIQLIVNDRMYSAVPGSGDPVDAYPREEAHRCLPDTQHYFAARFLCRLADLDDVELSVVNDIEFEGRRAAGLVATRVISQGDRGGPPGAPTPDAIIRSMTRWEMTLYVDASSFLPLGVLGVPDSDRQGTRYQSRSEITGGFIGRDSVEGLFDPLVLGYVPPEERDRRILENPALGIPVYWLGREADGGGGLPQLELGYLVDRHPEIANRGGVPNVRLSIPYSGSGGRVSLDLWQPGEWEKFKERLGGKFAWSWCSEAVESQVNGARVVILFGHEPPPHEPGQTTAVLETPGAPPPTTVSQTPTVPPVRTDPCPSKPYDRFMAEVHYPDVTIVVNGTLFYGGQEGESFGAFDTPAALEAVARALRLRKPGE